MSSCWFLFGRRKTEVGCLPFFLWSRKIRGWPFFILEQKIGIAGAVFLEQKRRRRGVFFWSRKQRQLGLIYTAGLGEIFINLF